MSRSQWLRSLRRMSSAARLQRLWVRIPPWAWMSICCECCALSSRGLCDELITRPEEPYRPWCVSVCDLENLANEEALAHWEGGRGYRAKNKQTKNVMYYLFQRL